ncbi:pilus assembly protein [Hydrogenothermus marinus]|uniref:Type IV pilus assembly protein PilY1 n=1 Tax=Hydrogenothermus marinus TaxID=133270 RepID=A0A3M0BIJ3_9AQUI|nr:PilC/PilY family type IV pilus protein [Hydrogenothermus marinus]RMA97011.1 type IV pilus assembly protein PilY1 [Hydrogenothermus marinus]
MKKLILLPIIIFSLVKAQTSCNIPPFLTTTVPPNILFVIDKSGSMSWDAYGDSYDSSITYEGYFIPNKFYKYNNGIWEETSASSEIGCKIRRKKGICSGNRLNWYYMSRMDLLRWATTGGKPIDCPDYDYTDQNCDPDLACTGSYCILKSTNGAKVKVPKSRLNGIVQQLEKGDIKPRLGALFFSSNIMQAKVYIGDYPYTSGNNAGNADPDHPYTYFKRFINALVPYGGTGTSIAMWEAYDYFKQSDDHNFTNQFKLEKGTYKDPMYFCDYQGKNCQPAPCAKNFIILASDGQWNRGPTGASCSIDSGSEDNSADPVVPAYWLHTKLGRTLLGNDINISAVYSLGLFLGGRGEQSLKNIAMYGSFDTSYGDWPSGTDGSHWDGDGRQYPWDTCYMDDCGNGKGSACTPLPTGDSHPDWDKNGDGLPDTFLNAKNATQIKDSLLAFIRDILKRTSSASSVSILSKRNTSGNTVLQAVFYPQKSFPNGNNIDWVGYLYNYWFYYSLTDQSIREDTNLNYSLDLNQDYKLDFIVDTSGNLKINAYDNSDTLQATYNSLDEVKSLWEAGEKLKDTSPNNRVIYTVSSSDSLIEFTTSNASQFSSFLGNTSTFPSCLNSDIDNLINYIRGEHINGCRDRRADAAGNTWKLGDIIYSTPTIVNYDNYSVAFVGANDGMLHAFKVGYIKTDSFSSDSVAQLCDSKTGNCSHSELGKELWAFIPKNALPYLRYLADPNYIHQYIVDLQPYIIRVDTNGDGITDKKILIGGMRLGGGCGCSGADCENPPSDTSPIGYSSYFALDITDPTNPQFLWEFTDSSLGFSFSGPAHITYNGKHFIMFLSGPTTKCGDSNQDLKIFILSMDNNFKIASTTILDGTNRSALSSFKNSFGGRLFTEGVDYNEDGNTDIVFFGVNKKAGSVWKGNVIGVKITSGNPSDWEVVKVFNSAILPITAKVEYMKCFGMNYIYFGTGRWFFKDDEKDGTANKLYGIRIDECLAGGNCNINAAHTSSNSCDNLSDSNAKDSWYIDLESATTDYYKERLISDPAITNYNVVYFATTEPTGSICGFGGRSRLWGLNCATGGDIFSNSCPGYELNIPENAAILLQLSRGNIEVINKSSFTQSGNKTTKWFTGTTPEAPPTVPGGNSLQSRMILWLEK